jgi:acyl carrier protein
MDDVLVLRTFLVDDLLADTGLADFDDDFDLLDHGMIDSLRLVKLIVWMERTFGCALADEQLAPTNFRSVNTIRAVLAGARTDGDATGR